MSAASDRDAAIFTAFCASGLWQGLGLSTAAALPEAGITVAEQVSVQALLTVPKVGKLRAERLYSAFIAAQPSYELVAMVVAAGLNSRLAGRCGEAFGAGAVRLLRDDPWRLLELAGVSVAEADSLARAVLPGVVPSDERRGRAIAGHVLSEAAREGHTVQPAGQVAEELLDYGVPEPERAIADACTAGTIVRDDDELLALKRYAEAERSIAESIIRLQRTAKPIGKSRGPKRRKAGSEEDPDGLDEVQRSAVHNALDHGVSVLTGGPGTGKSRTVATVVAEAGRAGEAVALAAPTGRAAKRLAELCDAEATTIHRLLGVQPRTATSADGTSTVVDFAASFARGTDWPLDEAIVVVDETSMLDVELAAALLRACPDGTHVVFVGDSAQLPSIGPGQVLADVIASGAVPVVELATVYRHDAGGAIATLAAAVRRGELPAVDSPDREVVIVPARGSADCAHRVVQLMTDSIPRALGISPDQVQVVTPVHRGPAGTIELNNALKEKLNPGPRAGAARRSAGRFDPGDRVVATANHLDATPTGFANGEVGVVKTVVDRVVTIDFGSGLSEVSGKALADISHGWAITVHRAQGSEFAAVIVVLPPEAGRMLSRPLTYTAITRAQRHLSVVHGAGPALARAVHDIGLRPRLTALRHQLTVSAAAVESSS